MVLKEGVEKVPEGRCSGMGGGNEQPKEVG
jgi:hypothetical protein